MDLTPQQRKAIERRIVERIIFCLENGGLKDTDVPAVSDFALAEIKKVVKHQDLINFLAKLSSKWPIFDQLVAIEKGKLDENVEDEVFEGVLLLSKNGKLDEAIKLAKSVTEKNA